MVFTINNDLSFIDSIQFMNSSLDTLVKNLPIMILKICLKNLVMNKLVK